VQFVDNLSRTDAADDRGEIIEIRQAVGGFFINRVPRRVYMLQFIFCAMLAVCLWVAPAVQAAPSYSSTGTAASYETKPAAVQAAPYPGESPAGSEAVGAGDATLTPDVERTAVVRQGRVPRSFYYLGQGNELVSIKVTAVNFPPEVSLKDPAGADVALESKPDGERSVSADAVLASPGRYTIWVRSTNASNGLFHIILSTKPAAADKSSGQPSK
jgi:hypothetical protein